MKIINYFISINFSYICSKENRGREDGEITQRKLKKA